MQGDVVVRAAPPAALAEARPLLGFAVDGAHADTDWALATPAHDHARGVRTALVRPVLRPPDGPVGPNDRVGEVGLPQLVGTAGAEGEQ